MYRFKTNPDRTYFPPMHKRHSQKLQSNLYAHLTDEEARNIMIDDRLEDSGLCAYTNPHHARNMYELYEQAHEYDDIYMIMEVRVIHKPGKELYISNLNIDPAYDAMWPDAMQYILEYARAAKRQKVTTRGDSRWRQREVVRDALLKAGFAETRTRGGTLNYTFTL